MASTLTFATPFLLDFIYTLMKALIPDNEAISTETLREHQIFDIEPEAAFDDLRRLAARICETPVALVSLVDECRQWFKMPVGMEFAEPKRDVA